MADKMLFVAVAAGDLDAVRDLVVDEGAEVNCVNANLMTPTHVSGQHVVVVRKAGLNDMVVLCTVWGGVGWGLGFRAGCWC